MVDRRVHLSLRLLPDVPRQPDRRLFLTRMASAAGLLSLAACARDSGPPTFEVALDTIPDPGRLRVVLGDEPVELLRAGTSVTARSLWCTHMGCELKWNPDNDHYECPCHEGRFNAEGRVLSGPPLQPMTTFPARVEEGRVVVTLDPGTDR